MKCPKCQSRTDVVDSRPFELGTTKRWMQCRECGWKGCSIEVRLSVDTGNHKLVMAAVKGMVEAASGHDPTSRMIRIMRGTIKQLEKE